MKFFTKVILAVTTIFFAFTSVSAQEATAQEWSNVKSFDANLLIGKTCRGGWTNKTGRPETGLGANIVVFSQVGNMLSATAARRFGTEAFKGNQYGMPFEDLGTLKNLLVNSGELTYTLSNGNIITLNYNGGELIGKIDLSNNPAATGTAAEKKEGLSVKLICV